MTQAGQICAKNNPNRERTPGKRGVQYKGLCPLENQQVDFMQMPKNRGNFKFLLVFCVHFFWIGRGIPL